MVQPNDRSQSSDEDSHREIFEPLRTYRFFILVFTAASALSALAITYVFSEKYEAQKTLVFKPIEVTRLREHDTQVFGAPAPMPAYKIIGTTLDDLAKSDLVLGKVVSKLGLDVVEPPTYSGPFYYVWYKKTKDWLVDVATAAWSILKHGRIVEDDPTADAIDTLRRDLRIRSDDSEVFTLRVRDKFPDRVVAIANEITLQLTMLLREIDKRPASLRCAELEEILVKKRLEIQDHQKQLTGLLDQYQVASISEEIEKGIARYSQLMLSAQMLEAEIRQSKATIAAYAEQLARAAQAAGYVDRIVKEASDLPSEAPTSYELGSQIKERLRTDEFRKIAADKTAAESMLSGLVAKAHALDTSISDLKQRLAKLPQVQVQYDLLHNQVQRLERDYSQINDALQEARIREMSGSTELAVQNESKQPKEPVTPLKVYHVLLSLILALLLSSGLAFVFDFFKIGLFLPSRSDQARVDGDRLRKLAKLAHRVFDVGDTHPDAVALDGAPIPAFPEHALMLVPVDDRGQVGADDPPQELIPVEERQADQRRLDLAVDGPGELDAVLPQNAQHDQMKAEPIPVRGDDIPSAPPRLAAGGANG
jgi:uncharacterized protein involved in exopolysaccharide biosynthesis